MVVTFAIALTLAGAGAPTPAPESGAPGDSQIIVVEVPDAARATPTGGPTDAPTSPPPGRPSTSATPDGSLPATGWDAAGLAAAAVIGSGALAAGILISRSRRRAR